MTTHKYNEAKLLMVAFMSSFEYPALIGFISLCEKVDIRVRSGLLSNIKCLGYQTNDSTAGHSLKNCRLSAGNFRSINLGNLWSSYARRIDRIA